MNTEINSETEGSFKFINNFLTPFFLVNHKGNSDLLGTIFRIDRNLLFLLCPFFPLVGTKFGIGCHLEQILLGGRPEVPDVDYDGTAAYRGSDEE